MKRHLLVLVLLCFSASLALAQVPQSSHVWLIAEENHSYEEVIGNPKMPYFNSLADAYGVTDQYYANTHNSISALMWLVAGAPVTGDNGTTQCFDLDNVVREALAQKQSWKSYQEDLPYAGYTGVSWANYVRRHNPVIDFTDSCAASQINNNVPYTQLATDMANNATPNYIWITPNLKHDAHDGPLSDADAWLSEEVPAILARPEFQPGGDGLLFIVFDESDLSGDNRCSARLSQGCGGRLATLVIGPQVKPGYHSQTLYAHENLLATICTAMAWTACPGAGSTALPMTDVFNTVTITSPFPDAYVSSPVNIVATTSNDSTVNSIQVYVDDKLQYTTKTSTLNTTLTMSNGSHHIVVQSWDNAGGIHKRGEYVTVQNQSVVVTAPAPNAVVYSPVTITATGGGKAVVNTMQIYVDDKLQYTASGASVNTGVTMSAGKRHVVVQAWDAAGGITKTGFYVTVVSAPSITITSPANNSSVYSPVQVITSSQDPTPVTTTQIYSDNVLVYEESGTGVNTPLNLSVGTHNVVIQEWNNKGATYTKGVTVTIKGVPVTITAPTANATLSSPVPVSASVPSDSPISTMQVYVDSVLKYQVSGQSVNTSLTMSTGTHYVVAQAWDTSGNTYKSGVYVTVK